MDELTVSSVLRLPMGGRRAVFSLDVEHDYGARTGRMTAFDDEEGRVRLENWLLAERVPLSVFLVTSLIEERPDVADWVARVATDVHAHSHLHGRGGWPVHCEVQRSYAMVRERFGVARPGYRAPQGRVTPEMIRAAAECGCGFSSSVFPTVRPGLYDQRRFPVMPFRYANGLLEVPMAVTRGVRVVVSVSYAKLLGWPAMWALLKMFGPGPVAVVDCHLHDLLRTRTMDMLPAGLRRAWSIRRDRGFEYARRLIAWLVRHGYRLVSIGELVRELEEGVETAA